MVSTENALKTPVLSELKPQAMREFSTAASEPKCERVFREIIADWCVR